MRVPWVIANGTSLSAAVDTGSVGNSRIIGIEMPSAWTAASMTFQVSHDGTNYFNLQTDAAEASAVVAASQIIGLRGDLGSVLGRFRWVKVRSGTAGAAVNQAAERTGQLLLTKN